MIKIQTLNMQYRNDVINKIRTTYQLSKQDSTLKVIGNMDIDREDYDGSIESLEHTCKNHLLSNIDLMSNEIRSTNMVYEGKKIKHVEVVFSSNLDNRELNITGRYTITAEEYENNSTIVQLEELAKEYIREEVEKA